MNAAIDFFSIADIFYGISYDCRYVEISIIIDNEAPYTISLGDKNINPDRNHIDSSLEKSNFFHIFISENS